MRKIFFIYLSLSCIFIAGCSVHCKSNDCLYQVSTINALMTGCYDSDITLSELRRNGDIGIGTLKGLDGEMFLDNGCVFQIKSDGKAYLISDKNQKTPFAAAAFFEPDMQFELQRNISLQEIENKIEKHLDNTNSFYAIRIQGDFGYVKTRSVPRQEKPYKPLIEVVKSQPVFEFENVRGTIVGFWLPDYVSGLNVTGFHFHFLNSEQTAGGHLLDCRAKKIVVSIDRKDGLKLVLPINKQFSNSNFNNVTQEDITRVEK